MALDSKRMKADLVIDNSRSLEETKAQFQEVLIQVTRPLTWREFGLSRKGIMACKNYLGNNIRSP
ncbi:hypothetical protein QJS04_geneDACA022974 [Acorus gramineus]|uniref:Uncharacterized protein n=1 Tax=Acorus gramineus TaxID=55184 RepID=A0AAV8ZZ27_ACOGR|nr:hypothetical protein QJS04_geneDACA022974 [Acorus gramineus]